MRLFQAGSVIDHDALRTWRTYILEASTVDVVPTGAVRLERVSDGLHQLATGGWMGRLAIRADGARHILRITDPKLDGPTWSRLLDDLAAAVEALPLAELVDGTSAEPVPGPSTRFIQALVARAWSQRLMAAIETILRRPHETLESESVWTTPDRARTATPAAVVAVIQRGSFGQGGALAARLGGVAPLTWLDTRRRTTADTPENRFVRHALESVLEIARWFPDDPVLLDLARAARHALTRHPLRGVARFDRFPSGSRVLHKRPGYREVRDFYLALRGAVRVRWDGLDSAIRGGLRNTEVLYQYWCFVALQRHLGVERPTLPTRGTTSQLHIELAEGLEAAVDTPAGRLWHERTFRRPRESYAIELRPDFSLQRPDGRWELFDAKFRIDDNLEAKHADLAKMHAYRDAITRCHSSTVLYPGDHPETHAADPNDADPNPSGIGVIPLHP